MATSTFNASLAGDSAVQQSKPGFFHVLAERFIAQRMAKARQITAWQLSSYSDAQLASYGWSAADIKRLRGGA